MKTQTIVLITLYIAMIFVTHRICSPKSNPEKLDYILIPLLSLFWPIPWCVVLCLELIDVTKKIIKKINP